MSIGPVKASGLMLRKVFTGKSVTYGAEGEDRTPDLVITNVFSELLDWVGCELTELSQAA